MLKHPDKTLIGGGARSFDFCGFKFNSQGIVALATATKEKFTTTLGKLYEHSRKGEVKVQH